MFFYPRTRRAASRPQRRAFRFESLESRTLLSVSPGYVEERFSTIRDLTEVNDELYFVAYGENERFGLWRTDGTDSGTVRVKELGSRDQFWTEYELTNVNGRLFFVADDGVHGREVWTSDGTEAGTGMVRDISPGPNGWWPKNLTNVDGTLYFAADDGVHGYELWKSDGTEAGTVMVADLLPGAKGGLPHGFRPVSLDGQLYFFAGYDEEAGGLFRSDGTDEGTSLIHSGRAFELVAMNDSLFFHDQSRLWRSDGTEAGTVLVKDLTPAQAYASYLSDLTVAGDQLFFTADDGIHGKALWRSDGSTEGTIVVRDNPGTSSWIAHWRDFTAVNGELFVAGVLEDLTEPYGLWRSDGTPEGTVQLTNLGSPNPSQIPAWLVTRVGDSVYFRANDQHGAELWKSDGTPEGTMLVRDILPGHKGALESSRSEMVAAGGYAYFTLFDTPFGAELWRSDGTAAGTVRVLPYVEFAGEPEGFFEEEGRDYFVTVDANGNEQMWQGDGTPQHSFPVGRPVGPHNPGGIDITPFPSVLIYEKWWGNDSIGFWEPVNNAFFLKHGLEGGEADLVVELGFEGYGWRPLVGNWDATLGDGIGLYRDGYFLIKNALESGPEETVVQYGPERNDWIPLAGDWNGDGHATIGLYDPATSTFFLRNELAPGEADVVFQFGAPDNGWKPLVGDWDGDGTDTVGFYSDGWFFLTDALAAGEAEIVFDYGPADVGWYPLAGDWNGDDVVTVGLYSGETFFLKNSHSSGEADLVFHYGPDQNLWIIDRAPLPWIPLAGNWFFNSDTTAVNSVEFPFILATGDNDEKPEEPEALILVLDELEATAQWHIASRNDAPVNLGEPIRATKTASNETFVGPLDADLVDAALS